jgi:hypothetical protein
MGRQPLLPVLPKELAPLLNRIAGKQVVVTSSASDNTATGNAVQVNGPVAGNIQYMYVTSRLESACKVFKLNLAYERTS